MHIILHNLKSSMHKPSHLREPEAEVSHVSEREDIERQDLLTKVLMFHSK